MDNIHVTRYSDPENLGFSGYIESGDCTWIIFLDAEGHPAIYYPNRDPETGAVIGEGILLK